MHFSQESLEILFSNYLTLNELELSKSILFEIKKEKRRELMLKVLSQPFSPKIHHFYFLEYLQEFSELDPALMNPLDLLVSHINEEEVTHFIEKLKRNEEKDYSTMYSTLLKDQRVMIVLLLENIFHSFPRERKVMFESFLKEENASPYLYGIFHSMMKPEDQRKNFLFLKYLKDEELRQWVEKENSITGEKHSFEYLLTNGVNSQMDEPLLSLYYLLNWSNYSLIFQNEMEIRKFKSNSIFSSILVTLLNKFDLNQKMSIPMETFQYFNEHSMLKCLFHFHLLNKESLSYLTKKEEINLFNDYWNAMEIKQQILTNTWNEDSNFSLNKNTILLLENDLKFKQYNNTSTLEKIINQHEDKLKEWKIKLNFLKEELKRVSD
jgi:hypothetical protein